MRHAPGNQSPFGPQGGGGGSIRGRTYSVREQRLILWKYWGVEPGDWYIGEDWEAWEAIAMYESCFRPKTEADKVAECAVEEAKRQAQARRDKQRRREQELLS